MRIVVIGAGAIGGTIACLLDRAGHDVTVIARGKNLEAIRRNGLQLEGAWGEHLARVDADSTVKSPPELVILATKALDAEQALRDHAVEITDARLLVVQNGLYGLATAKKVLPDSEIVGALAIFAASYLSTGKVAVTTAGPTYLGNYENDQSVESIAGLLRGVMPVRTTDNFTGALWSKLMVNQINAMPAITGLSAQETIANKQLRRVLVQSMKEAVSVAIANGVKFANLQGMSNLLLRIFRVLPYPPAQLLPLFIRFRMGKRPNPGSTLQSIIRGQKTEIDFLNGAIVETALRIGKVAPVNAELVRLVHEVESTAQFFSPVQVASQIDLVSSPEAKS